MNKISILIPTEEDGRLVGETAYECTVKPKSSIEASVECEFNEKLLTVRDDFKIIPEFSVGMGGMKLTNVRGTSRFRRFNSIVSLELPQSYRVSIHKFNVIIDLEDLVEDFTDIMNEEKTTLNDENMAYFIYDIQEEMTRFIEYLL